MGSLVYVGVGGNIGDRLEILQETLMLIACMPDVTEFKASALYETKPISDIPQPDYLNAVCRFRTSMAAHELLTQLQAIEKLKGKISKPKNAPRAIDLDILFFGAESYQTQELTIPHPRWVERLFVVIPLLELTPTVTVPGKTEEETIDLLQLKHSLEERYDQRIQKYTSHTGQAEACTT